MSPISLISIVLLLSSSMVCGQAPTGSAQAPLMLKARSINTSAPERQSALRSALVFGPQHLLLQFDQAPDADTVNELKARGIDVLAAVPENGLLVSVRQYASLRGLDVRYRTPLLPSDKISPLLLAAGAEFVLVEFHADTDMNLARQLLLGLGLELRENPDLHPRQLMIHANDLAVLSKVASLDEVSYLFPASVALVSGTPAQACAGALTLNGTAPQLIATYGDGWDGPGLGSATLNYVFSRVTAQVDGSSAQSEVVRAMGEWSKAVKVNWSPSFNATGSRTVNILWATGDHGDGYAFDGPGGVLAHTFYPAPLNPEPLAGDMHLDDAEHWRVGVDTDIFSVALHELGHALGLGHSDNPADVMYPYYRMVSGLSTGDKAAASTLYAAQDSSTATPLTLTINAVPTSTTSTTVALSGSVTGGTSTVSVTWSATSGASGSAAIAGTSWSIASIPLISGSNTITVTASSGGGQVSKTVTVTRSSSTPPPTSPDTTPPTLAIVSPSTSTVSTTASSITITGTAMDNVGVQAVTWTTTFGGAGTAAGTANWSATIPLLVGSNTITVKASDAAGNVAWRSLVVTRR